MVALVVVLLSIRFARDKCKSNSKCAGRTAFGRAASIGTSIGVLKQHTDTDTQAALVVLVVIVVVVAVIRAHTHGHKWKGNASEESKCSRMPGRTNIGGPMLAHGQPVNELKRERERT